MNEESRDLQITSSVGEYLTPGVKVFEIKERRVICQSTTGGQTDTAGEVDDLGE